MEVIDSAYSVDLRDVRHSFGRSEVLHHIDMAATTGVTGLLGPNGAGKTTLLRILATVLKPKAGAVSLLGKDARNRHDLREIRRDIGYLPQQFGYYPNFTVFEFVEYFALLKEMDPQTVRPAVVRAIERVGLENQARTKMKTLSGGMVRRVGIAQAIVNEPALLLLDEPTVGLDPEQRVMFRELLRDMANHSTVFVSTHLVEDVATACNHVVVMGDGRIVYRGTPDELMQAGNEEAAGDSAMERGYSAALASGRATS